MKSKHTPGPWTASKASAIHDQHIISDERGRTVAIVYGIEEHEANAALIAAAPELLDVVRRFVEYEDKGPAATGYSALTTYQRARAAIANAQGEGE